EVLRQDGVGCESCHGPAERWLGAHTRYGWDRLSPSEKETRFGMRPTKALDKRVGICVDCHVGSPGRDVNHDLIAAGHPRLSFEFGAYLANMPHHWKGSKQTQGPDYDATAWAIGQVASGQAALALLSDRASRQTAPWPEFAE